MNAARPRVGIILAAGRGNRMKRLSDHLPKPVLPILGKSVIELQIDALAAAGIEQVHVVVGHRSDEVRREIERLGPLPIRVRFTWQENAAGIAHALSLLEPIVDEPFVLLLGDAYFQEPRIDLLINALTEEDAEAVLAGVEETDEAVLRRDFCVVADAEGRVTRVIEKPDSPPSLTRGIGMYLFTPLVFDAIRRTPRSPLRNEYEITDTIQIMIDDGRRILLRHPVEGHLNLTHPRDILDLNLRLLAERGKDSLIDPQAKVDPEAEIVGSVISRGAVVSGGTRLERSLVFPEVVVPGGEFVRAVVTREGIERMD